MAVKEFLPPGSEEAIAAGCTCPVIDNAYGKGCMGGVTDDKGQTVYIFSGDCPLHGAGENEDHGYFVSRKAVQIEERGRYGLLV